jgi:hypothetical protein
MAIIYAKQHITLRKTLGASLALPKFQLAAIKEYERRIAFAVGSLDASREGE